MRIADYDPSRRAELAELMGRVWGSRPAEEELAWLFERNPLRPASVLLAQEGGRTVGTAALGFVPMSVGGERVEVGMAIRLATDPAHRGRGVFTRLMSEQERRARELGVPLLLSVANAASTPILTGTLGWSRLAPLRLWARPRIRWRALAAPAARVPGRGRGRAQPVERFAAVEPAAGGGDRVLRDVAWLNWRFADRPGTYTKLAGDEGEYAVVGRWRRYGIVAAVEGDLLAETVAAAGGPVLLATPPPWRRRRYLAAGFLPTPKAFTVLGKALEPAVALPLRPHFELGDLDFV